MFCRGYVKLNLCRDSEKRFGQDFEFKVSGDPNVWLRVLVDA